MGCFRFPQSRIEFALTDGQRNYEPYLTGEIYTTPSHLFHPKSYKRHIGPLSSLHVSLPEVEKLIECIDENLDDWNDWNDWND